MNIFDFAMKMEKDGENYYRDLARKCGNKGVANILSMLADDEVKHYNYLHAMKAGTPELVNNRIVTSEVLNNAKNVFEKMKDDADSTLSTEGSEIDLYRKAQKVEAESKDFYIEKANEVEMDIQKEILLQIAEEEKRHYFLLENLIEFLGRPNAWLENAEFFHLDEY